MYNIGGSHGVFWGRSPAPEVLVSETPFRGRVNSGAGNARMSDDTIRFANLHISLCGGVIVFYPRKTLRYYRMVIRQYLRAFCIYFLVIGGIWMFFDVLFSPTGPFYSAYVFSVGFLFVGMLAVIKLRLPVRIERIKFKRAAIDGNRITIDYMIRRIEHDLDSIAAVHVYSSNDPNVILSDACSFSTSRHDKSLFDFVISSTRMSESERDVLIRKVKSITGNSIPVFMNGEEVGEPHQNSITESPPEDGK